MHTERKMSVVTLANILTLIPAGLNNHIDYKVWDEIAYPFTNLNGAAVEVLGMDK